MPRIVETLRLKLERKDTSISKNNLRNACKIQRCSFFHWLQLSHQSSQQLHLPYNFC